MKKSLYILFLLAGIQLFAAESQNYYQFIGIDPARLQVDAEDEPMRQMQSGEITPPEFQGLKQKIKDKFIGDTIRDACQKKQRKLRDEYTKAQEKLEQAEGFDREAKAKALKGIQKKLSFSKTACDTLFDPKRRAQYDQLLSTRPSMASVEANIEAASYELPDKMVLLNTVIGDVLSQIEIPGPAAKIFNQDLELRSIKFLPMPTGNDVKYGLGFSGLMVLNKFEVRLSVYVIQDNYGQYKYSFIVDLPEAYKVSALFPSLTYLDAFKFPKAKFIIATFDGSDYEGYSFKRGFNFGAEIELEGPFKILSDLKDKSTYLKSLVFESKAITLDGLIPAHNILQANFKAIVPMRIGVDLRKINIIPKAFSDVINRITTDDFTLDILPSGYKDKEGKQIGGAFTYKEVGKEARDEKDIAGMWQYIDTIGLPAEPRYKVTETQTGLSYRLRMAAGVRIDLGTQSDPLKIRVLGEIIPISKKYPQGLLSVSGMVPTMLELKWLAIGNAAITFDFDGALMSVAAAAGIPFTGIGISGQIDLGKEGDSRVIMEAVGGLKLKAGGLPVDLVFKLSAENIRLANIVAYATELAEKAQLIKKAVRVEDIPTMTIHKLSGYCAFDDTTIGGQTYNAGIGAQLEFEFFDRKAGARLFIDDKYRVDGWGYMPHINWTVKGVEVFRLTGASSDKGPYLKFTFDPAEIKKGSFGLNATVAIPALTLKQKVDFEWKGSTLNADFETKFADFSVIFGIRMNTQEGVTVTSPLDDLLKEVKNLYTSADKSRAATVAAEKMVIGAENLMGLKEYNRTKELLSKAKKVLEDDRKVLEEYEENTVSLLDPLPKQELGSIQDLVGQIQALLQELPLLLRSAKKYRIPTDDIEQGIKETIAIYENAKKRDMEEESVVRAYSEVLERLNVSKESLQKQLRKNLKKAEKTEAKKAAEDKKSKPSILRSPYESIMQRYQEGIQDTTPFLLRKTNVKVDSAKKWEKLAVKFGFKGDFAAFLNKYAVQNLQKMRDNALKKLDQINEKMASMAAASLEATEQEIARSKEAIAKYQQEIQAMTAACSSLPIYKQAGCRARLVAAQANLKTKQGYLNLLLKPGKHVVKGVTGGAAAVTKTITQSKALRSATEGVLAVATAGMDMLARGVGMINVTEVRGEYTWDDMKALRLPKLVKLVARIDLPEEIMPPMEIQLEDLQFDFKNPKDSAITITQKLLMSVIQAQQNKYVGYAIAAFE